jgi:hypothetical protein
LQSDVKIPFALIVEGHGEEEAAPVLLRRLLREIDPSLELEVKTRIRAPATRLRKDGELKRHVELAARRGGAACRILILLDSEDECPGVLGPTLSERARRARPDARSGPWSDDALARPLELRYRINLRPSPGRESPP